MGDLRFNIDATNWILVATPDSKYAHSPNWSVFGSSMPQQRPACSTILPSWDAFGVPNRVAEGKPPCPKCVRALRHHLQWLTEWVESYENLTWPEPIAVVKDAS